MQFRPSFIHKRDTRLAFSFKKLFFGALIGASVLSLPVWAQNSKQKVVAPKIDQSPSSIGAPQLPMGPRLEVLGSESEGAETIIRKVFPGVTRIQREDFLPAQNGASSFMGLVGRLFGERAHPEFEGINVRRHLYHVFGDKEYLGSVHGVKAQAQGNAFDVFVFYNQDSTIRQLRLNGLPSSVATELEKGAYLTQFEGRPTEDFEVIRGRKGRMLSKGEFLRVARRPAGALARSYFDQILRSVRFNAAFMDVAFFITQHPDLDNNSERVIAEVSSDAPETVAQKLRRAQAESTSSSN